MTNYPFEKTPVTEKILDGCPKDILDRMIPVDFGKGENILLQGDEVNFVYLITQGKVRIYKLFDNGASYRIIDAIPYEFLGEVEAFAGAPSLNMADAIEPTKVLKMTKADFLRWVRCDSGLAFSLLTFSNERLYEFNSQVLMMQYLSKAELFWIILLRSYNMRGKISKEELEIQLAASPRTVNRLMLEGVSEDILALEPDGIIVKNIALLEDKCRNITKFLS